jgi:2-deoxy-D-gluconate 3-dehydrogenase
MTSLFDLSGKTAIVTGAGSGLGQGMAVALAEAGADVVVVARKEPRETEKMIRALGRKALSIAADLSEIDSLESIITKTVAAFGKVDILINNAGTTFRAPAIDFDEKHWDEIMTVNSKAVFFLCQAAARDMMKRNEGKIINIASLMSFQGGILVPAYTASKGAVAQITKALANEWASMGICVNAIAPGYMATKLTQAIQDDADREPAILSRIPAERWGTPDDLKGTAVFLASHASDYVNGHILLVDGGWMGR